MNGATTRTARNIAVPLAALAVLAAIVAIVAQCSGVHHRGTQAGHSAGPAGSPSSPVVPTVDLSGTRWADFRGYRLPVSADNGPRNTGEGLASGFADTPLGALLAIVNIGARTAWQFGPAVFQPTIANQVTGPYQQQMLTADQEGYAAGAGQTRNIAVYSRIVAYQWTGYTPSDATVDLVASASGNGTVIYVATQIDAQWLNGDWRVVAPPGGDWGNASVQIPTLNGYLTFPGQE